MPGCVSSGCDLASQIPGAGLRLVLLGLGPPLEPSTTLATRGQGKVDKLGHPSVSGGKDHHHAAIVPAVEMPEHRQGLGWPSVEGNRGLATTSATLPRTGQKLPIGSLRERRGLWHRAWA